MGGSGWKPEIEFAGCEDLQEVVWNQRIKQRSAPKRGRRHPSLRLSASEQIAGRRGSREVAPFRHVFGASNTGLSTRALLLEWMSLRGPRPQRSPLEIIWLC